MDKLRLDYDGLIAAYDCSEYNKTEPIEEFAAETVMGVCFLQSKNEGVALLKAIKKYDPELFEKIKKELARMSKKIYKDLFKEIN